MEAAHEWFADLLEVDVRVETLAHRVFELGEELLPVAAVQDVVGYILGFIHVEHDNVVVSHRSCRHALLVLPLAVNDRGHVFLAMHIHRVPHLHTR